MDNVQHHGAQYFAISSDTQLELPATFNLPTGPLSVGRPCRTHQGTERLDRVLKWMHDFKVRACNTWLRSTCRSSWLTRKPFGRARSTGSQIDHIFVSCGLDFRAEVASTECLRSDHYPVWVYISNLNFHGQRRRAYAPSFKGWRPSSERDAEEFRDTVSAALIGSDDAPTWSPSAVLETRSLDQMRHVFEQAARNISYTTHGQRRKQAQRKPEELMKIEDTIKLLRRTGPSEALRVARAAERKERRRWLAAKQRSSQCSNNVSLNTFVCDGVANYDRRQWAAELKLHCLLKSFDPAETTEVQRERLAKWDSLSTESVRLQHEAPA